MEKYENDNEKYALINIGKGSLRVSWDKNWDNAWWYPKFKKNGSGCLTGWLKLGVMTSNKRLLPLTYFFRDSDEKYFQININNHHGLTHRTKPGFEGHKKLCIEYLCRSCEAVEPVYLTKEEFDKDLKRLVNIKCTLINYELD